MVQIEINAKSQEERAKHVVIGFLAVALLFYLWFTGVFSTAVSFAMPESDDAKVSGAYDFITEVLGDVLSMVGIVVVAVVSSIWKLAVSGVSFLISRFDSDDSVAKLREDSVYTTQQIGTRLQLHEDRIAALEKAPKAKVAATRVTRTTAAKKGGAK